MKYILLNDATKQVVMELDKEAVLKSNIYNFPEEPFLESWEKMVKSTHICIGNTLYKAV